jgi:endonuclease YncB( thermonuclease family)
MKAGPKRFAFTVALTASVLAVVGLTGTALARDVHTSHPTEAARHDSQGKTFTPDATTPGLRRSEARPAPQSVNVPLEAARRVPEASIERIHQPAFSAAGIVENGSKSIRLIGIAATAPDAQCGSGPDAWPCGRMARAALQRFVRRRAVECRLPATGRPADGVAHCSVGGKDIGEWLVLQGWARAEGLDYAGAEKTARRAKRGVWSPVRPGLAPEPIFEVGPTLTDAVVRAEVDLSTQSMTLVHQGRIVGQWPVSTARDGKITPTGVWTAKWLSRHHRSRRYNNAPMPYSVFYDGDYAIHGTYQTDRLGRPASAGCVRLDPEHAAVLFDLVRTEGPSNTLIVIRQ